MEKDGMDFVNQIIHGDCEDVLKKCPENAVDLIFTSPPYADRRANTYGGVKPGDYVDPTVRTHLPLAACRRSHCLAI